MNQRWKATTNATNRKASRDARRVSAEYAPCANDA